MMLRPAMMFFLMAAVSLCALGQNAANPPAKAFYKLTFVVQELENEHVINGRSYSMLMRDADRSSIRAGEKVPFASSSGMTTQWEQINVGVNIDCQHLEVAGTKISLAVKADISSVTENQGSNKPATSVPIIRSNQWESNVVLPLGQPSIIFSSDDPASKRTMRLQLTVTPIR